MMRTAPFPCQYPRPGAVRVPFSLRSRTLSLDTKRKIGLCGYPVENLGATYEEKVYDALGEIYKSSVEKSVGLPKKTILEIIGKAAHNYRNGYVKRNTNTHKYLRNVIAKGMKLTTESQKYSILKLLFLMDGITANNYPVLNTYLSTDEITTATRIDAAKKVVASTAENIKEGIEDTIKESIQTAAKLVKTGVEEVNKNLPWYMNLKLLVPLGLGIVGIVYALPLLGAIKRPSYKTNPVGSAHKRAKILYTTFMGFGPKKTRSIPKINTRHLTELGRGLEIGYQSNKWEHKPNNYLHQFGKDVRLLASADGRTLILHGGKLRVTARGIVG